MATGIFNQKYLEDIFCREMNKQMVEAAEPAIQAAMLEIESKMRKKLGALVIAYIDNTMAIETDRHTMRILVKHDNTQAE